MTEPQNRTTVRTVKSARFRPPNASLRRAFALLERAAPPLAGHLATRMWFTLPKPAPAAPAPRTTGTPFEVALLGSTVRGAVFGDPGAPAVYLVHGWAGSAAQMQAWVDPLVAAGLRVVAYDALGHGASDADPTGRRSATVPHVAAALRAVVSAHGPARAVVAHSLGALATGWAIRGGLVVDRLVLIAPMTEATTYARGFVAALGGDDRTYRGLLAGIRRRAGVDLADIDLDLLPAEAHRPPLPVVHDRLDRQTPAAGAERLVEGWPDARLIETRGLGHHRVLHDPRVVADGVAFAAAEQLDPARSA